jgi:hypothetical protein
LFLSKDFRPQVGAVKEGDYGGSEDYIEDGQMLTAHLREGHCFALSKGEAHGQSRKQELHPTVQSDHLLKRKVNSKENYITIKKEKQIYV